MTGQTSARLREQVRSRYAEAARAVLEPRPGVTAQSCERSATDSCCGTGSAALDSAGCFGGQLYRPGETDGLPEEAVLASLGCGNPLAVADLHDGERVLDLGSGGGIDVLLSACRVGPSGFAYGVDMTDDMLTLARANATRAGAGNVEFLKGEIEAVPLPDAAVDVVISNCVINLSADKPAVLAEMFRVLAPGGRIGITDVVAEDHLTPADRAAAGSYVGCMAGALSRAEYLAGLAAAGFCDASVTFTHEAAPGMQSAIIRAVKRGRAGRCDVRRARVQPFASSACDAQAMAQIGSVVLNVTDIGRAAAFWRSALSYVPRAGDNPGALVPRDREGPALLLDETDRTHLDLHVASEEEQRAEVARLTSLGARPVDWVYPDGANFVVLSDTEGNLFCVVNTEGGQRI